MAQEVVVKESLSEPMVRDGAALVERLDQAGWRPSAAFWFYLPDASSWRLMLASPDVATRGPREIYTVIQGALGRLEPGHEIALDDISVLPADHPLVTLLRGMLTTGPGIARVRFSRNVIDGHFIEDALLYRMT